MEPRTTRPRRKQYVEVVACHGIDGSVSPQAITIVGGKTYQIESASQPKESFDPLLDRDAIRYRVRIHGKDTFLYRSRERWFVEMKDSHDFVQRLGGCNAPAVKDSER